MALETYGTIWVCVSCLHHHANGECGDCHDDNGHDKEPLSQVELPFTVVMGVSWDSHDDECLTYILSDLRERFPDIEWPSIPGDYECDCETDTFSQSRCDGCGSYLHGERHGMTLFKTS